ncbi:sulfite exporter TauE/SafE family protein, partial [Escherichia coli]|nr:sulfite exporter TauE/SafE family protein [Escherichia coli]
MNDIAIIALAGFTTGITTVLFGFGGGFVVVPFVYQLMLRQSELAGNAMHIAVATSTAVMIFNAGWVSY